MLRQIVNLLKGQVTGRVESGFPERVLNLCAAHGLAFWDLRWESAVAFTFTTTRRDWRRLRKLSRRLDCRMEAIGWKGAPFFLGRLRHRYALWVTLAVGAALLFYGSFFIWDFSIEGNETVSDREILRVLDELGVGFGSYGYGVNSVSLRNFVLLEIPELSYFAVNVKGCRAYVQVRERIEAPELVSNREPGNTVAAKDALVTAIQPWGGEKMVLPGTTVREGQLLISGVVENDFSGARFLRGMGKVYGRTWYTLQCRIPLTVTEKIPADGESVRWALLLGKKRVNLYFNSSISGDTCDKMISWNQCRLPGDIPLPLTLIRESEQSYTLKETRRSRDEALAVADAILTARLEESMDGGSVLSRELSAETENDTLLVTLTAECEEQIGKFVDIPKE